MTPLAAALRARIAAQGPVSLAEAMAVSNAQYYATRDPFGAAGDFITAPEISQMFGELAGAWLGHVHAAQGLAEVVLAELGPGRGTLMADALRVLERVPGLVEAASLWLVETSPLLRTAQAERLENPRPRWAARVEDLPEGPLLVVANEFFDALPVHQFRKLDPGWQERMVGLEGEAFVLTWGPLRAEPALDAGFPLLPEGAVVEVSPEGEAVAALLGARIAAQGGAALLVDYGAWEGTGDTLQALRGHRSVPALDAPGEADLTAHVRFRPLAAAAAPARAWGPTPQGAFLRRLGIVQRAERLALGRDAATRGAVEGQLRRLTHPDEMGSLFQVMALLPPDAAPPPGFEDA